MFVYNNKNHFLKKEKTDFMRSWKLLKITSVFNQILDSFQLLVIFEKLKQTHEN